jgi:hypothetical protein
MKQRLSSNQSPAHIDLYASQLPDVNSTIFSSTVQLCLRGFVRERFLQFQFRKSREREDLIHFYWKVMQRLLTFISAEAQRKFLYRELFFC